MKKMLARMTSDAITKVASSTANTDSVLWINKPQAPQELLQK